MSPTAQTNYGTTTAGAYRDAPPAPMNPLPGAIDQLGYTINDLNAAASVLTERLGRVLAPTPAPTAGSDHAKLTSVASASSAMVDDVEALRRRVANITAGLQDVLNRLEV